MASTLTFCFLAIVLVLLIFRFLTALSKRRNRRSGPEIAATISRHIQGIDTSEEWDQFISVPIPDKRLDEIRRRCIQLDNPGARSPNEINEFNEIVEMLRNYHVSYGA